MIILPLARESSSSAYGIIGHMKFDNAKLIQLLRERGLRPTTARLQILTLLIEYKNHSSADELLSALRKNGHQASPATLYQNLANLVDAGLLKRFTGADGLVRYDSNLMPHHHLICIRCGKVEDALIGRTGKAAVMPLVLQTGKPPAGWKLDGLQLEFKGVCPRCLKKR